MLILSNEEPSERPYQPDPRRRAALLALSNTGEFLFTKTEGAAGGGLQECIVYSYVLDVQTGALSPLAPTDTGLMQACAYHGMSANPAGHVPHRGHHQQRLRCLRL